MSRLAGSAALDLRSSAGRTRRTWEIAELRHGGAEIARELWLGKSQMDDWDNYRTKCFFPAGHGLADCIYSSDIL